MCDAVGNRQNLERSGLMSYVPHDPASIHDAEPSYTHLTPKAIVTVANILFRRICIAICVTKTVDPMLNAEFVHKSLKIDRAVSKIVDIYNLGDVNGLPALYAMLSLRNVKEIDRRLELVTMRVAAAPIPSNIRLYQMALVAQNVAKMCEIYNIVPE